jgi:hypothetical protein
MHNAPSGPRAVANQPRGWGFSADPPPAWQSAACMSACHCLVAGAQVHVLLSASLAAEPDADGAMQRRAVVKLPAPAVTQQSRSRQQTSMGASLTHARGHPCLTCMALV